MEQRVNIAKTYPEAYKGMYFISKFKQVGINTYTKRAH
jgi:hypothetical protein